MHTLACISIANFNWHLLTWKCTSRFSGHVPDSTILGRGHRSPLIQLQFNIHAVTQQSSGITAFAKFSLLGLSWTIRNSELLWNISDDCKTLGNAGKTAIQSIIHWALFSCHCLCSLEPWCCDPAPASHNSKLLAPSSCWHWHCAVGTDGDTRGLLDRFLKPAVSEFSYVLFSYFYEAGWRFIILQSHCCVCLETQVKIYHFCQFPLADLLFTCIVNTPIHSIR